MVQGVPALGTSQELIQQFAVYGAIQEYRILDEYPTADRYHDVYLINFQKIQSAWFLLCLFYMSDVFLLVYNITCTESAISSHYDPEQSFSYIPPAFRNSLIQMLSFFPKLTGNINVTFSLKIQINDH